MLVKLIEKIFYNYLEITTKSQYLSFIFFLLEFSNIIIMTDIIFKSSDSNINLLFPIYLINPIVLLEYYNGFVDKNKIFDDQKYECYINRDDQITKTINENFQTLHGEILYRNYCLIDQKFIFSAYFFFVGILMLFSLFLFF